MGNDEIKKWQNKIQWKDLKYETNVCIYIYIYIYIIYKYIIYYAYTYIYIYNFKQFETSRSFGDNNIYTGIIIINESEMD